MRTTRHYIQPTAEGYEVNSLFQVDDSPAYHEHLLVPNMSPICVCPDKYEATRVARALDLLVNEGATYLEGEALTSEVEALTTQVSELIDMLVSDRSTPEVDDVENVGFDIGSQAEFDSFVWDTV